MAIVTTAFINQYRDNITQLVQQKQSKLRGTVLVDTNFTGEFKFYDQYGASEMVQKTGRNQDTPSIDPDHQRRRISKSDWIHNVLFDLEDQLSMIVDPKSTYAQSAAMAAGRKMDDIIIEAFNATAKAGKAGGTDTSFDSAFQVAVAGAGLTKNKLLDAMELLDDEDVEEEDRTCVCTPKQIRDLLKTVEVTSSDYNTVKALVDGQVNTFLGFNFIKISSKRLPTDGTNRLVYCYHKAAMQLAIQKEATVNIDKRNDKNYAWQVHLAMTIGSTRLEEERIVQIACSE